MTTRIAALGDVHGDHRAMIAMVQAWERHHGASVDAVLQVGDFEPHRHADDLATMAAPAKYRRLGDFPAIASGDLELPWPVYFIGGNHEPYGWLEMFASGGGEIVPRCHYLGRVGAVELAGLRVAGVSGIHVPHAWQLSRPDLSRLPYVSNKAFIHFTEWDLEALLELAPVDVLLLHDWPAGIVSEVDRGRFERPGATSRTGLPGNAPARMMVDLLEPRLVLCGHHHARYHAEIAHASGNVSEICCLGKVAWGEDALAVFEVDDEGGGLRRLPA